MFKNSYLLDDNDNSIYKASRRLQENIKENMKDISTEELKKLLSHQNSKINLSKLNANFKEFMQYLVTLQFHMVSFVGDVENEWSDTISEHKNELKRLKRREREAKEREARGGEESESDGESISSDEFDEAVSVAPSAISGDWGAEGIRAVDSDEEQLEDAEGEASDNDSINSDVTNVSDLNTIISNYSGFTISSLESHFVHVLDKDGKTFKGASGIEFRSIIAKLEALNLYFEIKIKPYITKLDKLQLENLKNELNKLQYYYQNNYYNDKLKATFDLGGPDIMEELYDENGNFLNEEDADEHLINKTSPSFVKNYFYSYVHNGNKIFDLFSRIFDKFLTNVKEGLKRTGTLVGGYIGGYMPDSLSDRYNQMRKEQSFNKIRTRYLM